ncbi:ABC transporter family substrate-binding protein [Nocardioides sp. ChNu-153]|uniref:ABC transporter substrate-binding protein n=1 Tax=unclassified Nocardioides TaxID=2615069 RepID=UPI002406DE21|nr:MULTISPECIES: ABC transporter substrate-binding protein [unclassified Nocardioides]MDF9716906.1 hypothetical protein [Nocardioides sp. ChNu-99]MDN7122626.1 ABC transporter family substrate-binding protein [Nocardioides sp. ChNu-153]
MRLRRIAAATTAVALGAALAACAPPEDENENEGNSDSGAERITVGWNQPFFSYNDDTSNGNATANAILVYLTRSTMNFYDAEQELQTDESFGTYEKISDDPLTVKYTVADDARWSDGTPVDAADLLLAWAAGSGKVNTIEADQVETDDNNVPVLGEGQVYFDSSSAGLPLTETPEISDDNKSMTLTYSEPFADWELQIDGGGVAAHATVMNALDITDPMEAKQTLIDAVMANDATKLGPISSFWNSGFDFKSLPEDESLYLSSGAYVLTEMEDGQYATLEENPEYTGDRPASIPTVTVQWNEDPNAQAQQLANGEIDLVGPQATTDIVEALQNIDGTEVETGVEASYEHVDLVVDNGGPFDPATYGGDAETARTVRQAFLTAYPRQDIIDRLIAPLEEGAETRDSFIVTPGSPTYDEIVGANGSDEYAESDPAAAAALLESVGVSAPTVRIMFAADNVRRENQFEIIKPALEEAGFVVEDARNVDWGSKLGDGTYDAAFFAWQSTSTGVTESQATYYTGGLNNLTGYTDPAMDALWDELSVTTDEDRQVELQTQIDQMLYDNAYGLPLFQFPSVAAWNSERLEGVEPAPLSPTIFHGYWNWSLVD